MAVLTLATFCFPSGRSCRLRARQETEDLIFNAGHPPVSVALKMDKHEYSTLLEQYYLSHLELAELLIGETLDDQWGKRWGCEWFDKIFIEMGLDRNSKVRIRKRAR